MTRTFSFIVVAVIFLMLGVGYVIDVSYPEASPRTSMSIIICLGGCLLFSLAAICNPPKEP